MTYNLHSDRKLTYPHHTKITENEILIVTSPENVIKVGDIVYAKREYAAGYFVSEKKIKSIEEQRPAMGNHSIENPIFQRCAF